MFNPSSLKQKFNKLFSDPSVTINTELDNFSTLRAVTAHMLVHATRVDSQTDTIELNVIQDILEKTFGDDPETAKKTIKDAINDAEKHEDWYRHLRKVTPLIEEQERLNLIRHLWQVILADGRIDSFEANFMRRISNLLGISDKEANKIKVQLSEK